MVSEPQQREQLPSNIDINVKQISDRRWSRTDVNFKGGRGRRIITMRTSSQRLAAVRKREAMLLASVNCSNLCLNLGSYLPTKRISFVNNVIALPPETFPVCLHFSMKKIKNKWIKLMRELDGLQQLKLKFIKLASWNGNNVTATLHLRKSLDTISHPGN